VACALALALVLCALGAAVLQQDHAAPRALEASFQPYFQVPHGVHGAVARPPTYARCLRKWNTVCYTPSLISAAYDTAPIDTSASDGTGQTIAIIDSFGSPTIRHDLDVFDAAYGLPAPPSFTISQPAGTVPPFDPSNPDRAGWAMETSLDVEWAHAMAPGASIALVETPTSELAGSSGFPEIATAETWIVEHHVANVISESFGTAEQTFRSARSITRFDPPLQAAAAAGVTVVAATGDQGSSEIKRDGVSYFSKPVVGWPASDPLVTAVGGTHLQLTAAGEYLSDPDVWNDTFSFNPAMPLASGAGRSSVFGRPAYQDGVASTTGDMRTIPDISMTASCTAPVVVYMSAVAHVGWQPICGTSVATPLFAGIVARADEVAGKGLGQINPALYAMLRTPSDDGIVDVYMGSNSVMLGWKVVAGYRASRGFDIASGIGTIDAALFVPALAAAGS
jgi:subtilase family serine protease